MREYDICEVEKLQEVKAYTESFGTEVQVKPIPTDDTPGILDPHELAIIKNHWVARGTNPEEEDIPEWDRGLSPIEKMRDNMGFPNHNICNDEIHTRYETIMNGENEVGIWYYYRRATMRKPGKPALMFIHGGGWVGGTPYTVENFCRFIAEKADAVVFNIDYSLAPEKKWPNGLLDCFAALKHIYDNADKYNIDKNKIGVSGDSAGGNLTCCLSLMDRDLGTNMIHLQVPIYPVVTFFATGNPKGYKFDINKYEIEGPYKEMLDGMITLGRPKSEDDDSVFLGDMYVNRYAASNPYVSPLYAASLANQPKTLIVGAEFDGLREQLECYGKLLRDEGNDVRILRYKGVSHAFIDRIGFVPQAEDLALEISEELKNL